MRVELHFTSGKFIAYDAVDMKQTSNTLTLVINHPDYKENIVTVNMDKLDFFETMKN